MTTVLVLCVQVINLNSALCRLCYAHWPLQRGLPGALGASCSSSEPMMLDPSSSVAPLRLSFVFLVHSTRCSMLRRTFVFLMLVINNLSCAPLLSDDDEKTIRWARRRWADYALLLSLPVCLSFHPSAMYTMPCLSLQRIAFQLHFVGRCVKRSFPSPFHLPLPSADSRSPSSAHFVLFFISTQIVLFAAWTKSDPIPLPHPSRDARLYYNDFSWTHFSYVVVFLLSLSLLPFVIFMILFPLTLSHNSWYAAASATVACFCCLLFLCFHVLLL